jgi:hypothetical protein
MIQRLKAPTPSFWKKVRNVGIAILGGGGAILALQTTISVPQYYLDFALHMTIVGSVIVAMAQATKAGE